MYMNSSVEKVAALSRELGVNNTLIVFPTCRKGRLKGIQKLRASNLQSLAATETPTTPSIRTDLTPMTFDYRNSSENANDMCSTFRAKVKYNDGTMESILLPLLAMCFCI